MKRSRSFDGILRGCLQGDDGAWRLLLAEHVDLVTAIMRRLLARRALPHDQSALEEETASFFADLCANREQAIGAYRGDGPFSAYLAVMAANYVRRRAVSVERERRGLADYATRLEKEHAAPADEAIERTELPGCLAACTPQEKLLYTLFYVDGASAEEVAALLGISRAAVYLRKHRFHEKVRALQNERSAERSIDGPISPPE